MTILHWATKGKYGRHRNNPSRREWERHKAKIKREWLETPRDPIQYHLDWVANHKELAVGPGYLPALRPDEIAGMTKKQLEKAKRQRYGMPE